MITIDLQSRTPIYEQLKTQINRLVLTGDLKPNDQLPSVRSFARELGINPNTVQKAYQELERDGLIYSVTGKGNYISGEPNLISNLIKDEKENFYKSSLKAKAVGIEKDDAIEIVNKAYINKEG